jgi:DNA adenine methylase
MAGRLRTKTIFRWVGGKSRLVYQLKRLVPDFHGRCYFEPFFGAGSLFFELQPRRARLGDLNRSLIDCLRRIRANPDAIWSVLASLKKERGPDGYYLARDLFNIAPDSDEKAGLFLYLNRTCFNGIWRVSRVGQFNVPYGGKLDPVFPSRENLHDFSRALQVAVLRHGDFAMTAADADRGDFVYLDPPYPPINGTAYFTHYTRDRFGDDAQRRIAEFYVQLHRRGCLLMLSIADTPLVRRLYSDFAIRTIPTQRWVAAHGRRYLVQDLVVTNYKSD